MFWKISLREKFGGEGSGNYGHSGRPGEVGGSGEGGSGKELQLLKDRFDDLPIGSKRINLPIKDGIKSQNPSSGFGDCTKLAMQEYKQNGSAIFVGYTLPTELYNNAIEKHTPEDWGTYRLDAFPHAWNVADGKIIDHSLGSKDAKDYTYLGKEVPGSVVSGLSSDTELARWKTLFGVGK